MRVDMPVRSSAIARFIGAFAAFWLSAGSAWAGAGADFGSLQTSLNQACTALQMTPCPQLPTITQLVLELAGLENAPPEVVRFENAISPTVAISAVNAPAGSPFEQSNVSPLAFISPETSGGVAMVTELGNPAANSFFYAATDGVAGTPPTMLNLFYDYPALTVRSENFAKGQFVADISIPLVVLNHDGTESDAPITIEIRGATGCATVPCVSFTAVGNFGRADPASLGLTVRLTFNSSPNSSALHAIFEIQAPLLVTKSNDPAYFESDLAYAGDPFTSFLTPAFTNDEPGFSPKSFGGVPVGIAPDAAPRCTRFSCPPTTTTTSSFPLCATIADDSGAQRPAVAAFYSIGTVGTTYLSAPVVRPSQVTCPF